MQSNLQRLAKNIDDGNWRAVLDSIRKTEPVGSYYNFMEYYAMKKISSNIEGHAKQPELKVDVRFQLADHCAIIIWIGRFRSRTGYGKATRDYFHALSRFAANRGLKLIGIDSQNLNTLGDVDAVKISLKDDIINIEPTAPNTLFHVVIHETPDKFDRIQGQGKVTLTGYTVHEFSSMIINQHWHLGLVNQLLVPSEWNKNLLVARGYCPSFVSAIPHISSVTPADIGRFKRLGQRKTVKFLAIMSNPERKDIRTVIMAFRELNNLPEILASLTVKLPFDLSEEEIERKIIPFDAASLNELQDINFVKKQLTDTEMEHLLDSHDCLVNIECGKGFDIDSLYTLVLGNQCVSTLFGGNSEYQNERNTYVVNVSIPEYYSDANFVNRALYSGVCASKPSVTAVAEAMLACYQDLATGTPKNTRALAQEVINHTSPERIATLFFDYFQSISHDFNVKSLHNAALRVALKPIIQKKQYPFQLLTISEIERRHSLLKYPSDFASKEDWLKDRRSFIGKLGGLPPNGSERETLESLRGRFRGKRCFVIGNGPSLNKINLELLKNEYTFCANKFYLKIPELSWVPTFYTCLDWTVTPDDSENLQEFFKSHPDIIKLIPTRFKFLFPGLINIYHYFSIPSGESLVEKFEIDALHGVKGGGTVATAMIQLAAFMGFENIILIGTDVSYKIPTSVKQTGGDKFKTGTQLHLQSTADDDENHFCPTYFGQGTKWHDPNVPEMKRGFRNSYLAARLLGISIYNATHGGDLNQVPRVCFNDLFSCSDE